MGASQVYLGFILVAILAIAFIAPILWAYRQEKTRQNIIEALGFQRWPDVDARFSQSVCTLVLHPYPERLDVQQAYRRLLPDMQLVVFDLVEKFGAELHGQHSKFAVYLQDEELPVVRVMPKLVEFGKGELANSARITINGLLKIALDKSGEKQLNLSSYPELDQRFIITALDEAQGRKFLTPDRLAMLSQLPRGVLLQAGGPVILIDRLGIMPDRRNWQQYLGDMDNLAIQSAQIIVH